MRAASFNGSDFSISFSAQRSEDFPLGVERGWQEREAAEGSRLAGIRTFGLISLLGGLWDLLSRGSGEILLGIAFLGFVVLMAVAHVAEARAVTITASPP